MEEKYLTFIKTFESNLDDIIFINSKYKSVSFDHIDKYYPRNQISKDTLSKDLKLNEIDTYIISFNFNKAWTSFIWTLSKATEKYSEDIDVLIIILEYFNKIVNSLEFDYSDFARFERFQKFFNIDESIEEISREIIITLRDLPPYLNNEEYYDTLSLSFSDYVYVYKKIQLYNTKIELKKIIDVMNIYKFLRNNQELFDISDKILFDSCDSIVSLLIFCKFDNELFDFIIKNMKKITFDSDLEEVLLSKITNETQAEMLLLQYELKQNRLRFLINKMKNYWGEMLELLKRNKNIKELNTIYLQKEDVKIDLLENDKILLMFNDFFKEVFVDIFGFDVIFSFGNVSIEIDHLFPSETEEINHLKINFDDEQIAKFKDIHEKIVCDLADFEEVIDGESDFRETLKMFIGDENKFINKIKDKLNILYLDEMSYKISNDYYEEPLSEEEVTKQQLLDQFKNADINNYEEKVNQILLDENTKKVIFSGVILWEEYKNKSIEHKQTVSEFTPYISNYLKSFEIFLLNKVTRKKQLLEKENITLKRIYDSRGIELNILTDKVTLGSLYKYIRREPRLIKKNLSNEIIARKIERWVNEVRNSHFHTHLISSEEDAQNIIDETLKLFSDIIYYFG